MPIPDFEIVLVSLLQVECGVAAKGCSGRESHASTPDSMTRTFLNSCGGINLGGVI